jgi:hypothetical protein
MANAVARLYLDKITDSISKTVEGSAWPEVVTIELFDRDDFTTHVRVVRQ